MFFRHLKNVLSRPDNSRTKLRCLEDALRRLGFKKHFKFHNFSEILYCSIPRLRNTNLSVFIQCQYTRNIFRNKNMGQSLFKKYSKFQNFDEIFYCGMTRLKNTNLDVFIQSKYTRAISKKKNMGTESA